MKRALRNLARSRAGFAGAAIVVVFALMAIFAPLVVPQNPTAMDLADILQPPHLEGTPSTGHWLGTDQLGRDIFSRIIMGSRITLAVALAAVVLGGVVGIVLGLVSGFFGGWWDRIIMRLADIQLSIPLMLFALLVIAALGASFVNLVAVLALTGWTRYARVVRGDVLSLREREFVLSARAAGASSVRMVVRHILPNVVTAATVVATLELARVVILESALSFLGMGVQPPAASWGRMLAEGRGYVAQAWWMSTFPGIAIVLVVLGVNLLGDWLRDYFDPKLTGS